MSNALYLGIASYLVFLFSITAHEASHALASLKLGDDTAYRGGQVTLDPTPHIQREPWGMVVFPILTYFLNHWMMGWASAPLDPLWARQNPRRAGLVYMAGPASNFIIAIFAAILIRIGIAANWFEIPDSVDFYHVVTSNQSGFVYLAGTLLSILFSLNLMLGCFNLLPLPPLDGSSIPLFFLSESGVEAYWSIMGNPAARIFGLLIAWKIFEVLYSPIQGFARHLLYPGYY